MSQAVYPTNGPASVPGGHPVDVTDPGHVPVSRPNAFDRWALARINDERDLPFVRVAGLMSVTVIPFGVLLFFVPGYVALLLAPLHLALVFAGFLDRYILMLHNTSHRPLFKKQYGWLNRYIPWVLGPFFGETPETYFAHHLGMHHPENNLAADLSSTMRYERDRLTHWLHYWASFMFTCMPRLGLYLRRKGRSKLARRMAIGELSALVAYGLLAAFVSWQATLVVFVFPLLAVRFLMMAGNWAQHAFIDPAQPSNPHLNSITCINCRYNRRAFNDGYHIGHHVKASRHWTELPGDFLANVDAYARDDAIVFEGIDFFGVWLYLMLGRYDWLADHYVQLGDRRRSKDEIIALLRSRTRPMPGAAS